MGLKNFLRKLFEEEEDNTVSLLMAMADFTIKMKNAKYERNSSVCFDPRSLATNFGSVNVGLCDDVMLEKKALNYLSILSRNKLYDEYNRAYLLAEITDNSFFDLKFPDPDHPRIKYFIKPTQYMFLTQKQMGVKTS